MWENRVESPSISSYHPEPYPDEGARLLPTIAHVEKVGCRVKWRYIVCAGGFFGLFTSVCQRVTFTMCVVAMINTSHVIVTGSDQCPALNNTSNHTNAQTGNFNWDSEVEGQLLGAFFYGYVISQLPGGYLADRFGASRVMGLCGLLSGVLTALTPMIVRLGPTPLIISRAVVGLIQGPLYPTHHGLWGKWAPELERSRLYGFSSSGGQIAYFVASAATGCLADSSFLGGWPAPLYISGGLSCIWFVVWMFISHDTPAKHRFISDEERRFIEESIWKDRNIEYSTLPWRAILQSRAVWSILVFNFLDGLAFYVLFSSVPLYMQQVLQYDISQDGLLNAIPYLVTFLVAIVAAPVADLILKKQWMSTTNVRKLFTAAGELPMAPVLVAVGLVGCNPTAVVWLLVAGNCFGGLYVAGVSVAILDIAPRYAGTLMGLLNTFGNMGGFLSPITVGLITKESGSLSNWRVVFFITAGFYVLKTLVFVIFGTAEEQEWALGRPQVPRVNVDRRDLETEDDVHSSIRGNGHVE